jgi:putative MATE family efflux protein
MDIARRLPFLQFKPHGSMMTSDSDRGKLRKTILGLALPTLGENVLRMIIGIAEVMIVGRLGAEAIATVGLSWSLLFFFIMITFAINHGATAIVARYVGAKDENGAKEAAGQSLVLTFLLGALISAVMLIYAEKLFVIMKAQGQVLEMGPFYLRILASTFIADTMLASSNAVLRATGNTKTPMKIVGTVNLINIFLAYCLVYGKFGFPECGVFGAAYATASVHFLSLTLSFGGLLFGWYNLKLTHKNLYPIRWATQKKIFNISWPLVVEQILYASASMAFIRIISGLGTNSLAINNVVLRAESLAYMPGLSFSVAATVMVGQSLGENNREKAEDSAWESAKLGMLIMGLVGALFFFIPEKIVGMFTTDPAVFDEAVRILRIVSVIQPIQGLMFVLLGVFKGAADTRTTMIITIVGMWLIRVPSSYLFCNVLNAGVAGAWAGMCLHIAIAAMWAMSHYKKGKWRDIKV